MTMLIVEQNYPFATDLGRRRLRPWQRPHPLAGYRRGAGRQSRDPRHVAGRLTVAPAVANPPRPDDNPQMEIRAAAGADARPIAEVHVRSWQAAYRGQIPEPVLAGLSVDAREKWWEQTLGDPANRVLVADEASRIVAFVNFGPLRDDDADPESVGEVYAIYCRAEFWGPRDRPRSDGGGPRIPARPELRGGQGLGPGHQPPCDCLLPEAGLRRRRRREGGATGGLSDPRAPLQPQPARPLSGINGAARTRNPRLQAVPGGAARGRAGQGGPASVGGLLPGGLRVRAVALAGRSRPSATTPAPAYRRCPVPGRA